MWFSLLAACRPEPSTGPGLREDPPLANCESTSQFFAAFDGEVDAEPYQVEWSRWDGGDYLVEVELEDSPGEPASLYSAEYDAHDNALEEYWWQYGSYLRVVATELDGPHVVEETYEYGQGPPDEPYVDRTETLTYVWSGGVEVAGLWDADSDGTTDVAISIDHGWESPERWSWTSSEDYGLDGTIENAYGWVTGSAFVVTEEWEDRPIGGEFESLVLSDVDEDGRTWSLERFQSGFRMESCTFTWDGLVTTGSSCDQGGEVPTARTRLERIDGPDGRPAEWRSYLEDLQDLEEDDEVLTAVTETSFSCPAEPG